MEVTWMKISQSYWCLVALSNPRQSKLVLWKLSDEPIVVANYYLPGPVMDGMYCDFGDDMLFALSIGTRFVLLRCIMLCEHELTIIQHHFHIYHCITHRSVIRQRRPSPT